jgi:hypothetical protein
MSDKLNTYSFLPWVREGIANRIVPPEESDDKLRATLNYEFELEGIGLGSKLKETISKKFSLYGPGDIIGLGPKVIIKTEPHNWITNFEPNYLPCIDFYDEDLPWRYSPDIPRDHGRLHPWLALVVLEEGIFTDGKDMTNKPLPYFQLAEGVTTSDVFPPAEQLWAWAHVHVNRDLITNDSIDFEPPEDYENEVDQVISRADQIQEVLDQYADLLEENPDLAYSRIMCPIKLKENTAYHAFLIPAFESGRLAGLGLDVEEIFSSGGEFYTPLLKSWAGTDDPVVIRTEADKFPIYHRWYFRTGMAGDFEYLVRLLEPKPIDSRVGTRNVDVTSPGMNLIGIRDGELKPDGTVYDDLKSVLRLGGALRIPVDTMENKEEYLKYKNWDQPFPREFQRQLASFINLSDDYSGKSIEESHGNPLLPEIPVEDPAADPDPIITPPLYGRWHSRTKRLLGSVHEVINENWVNKLNLDPCHRIAAGFGTRIIQKNQENYMESAWKQVGDVLEANKRIRQTQFSMFASITWYIKYIKPLYERGKGALLWLTQPMQNRIVSKVGTGENPEELLSVKYQVKNSKVSSFLFSPEIRRFTRPGGRLSDRLGLDEGENAASDLLEAVNSGTATLTPDKEMPAGKAGIDELAETLEPSKVPDFFLRWIRKFKWLKYLFLALAAIIIVLLAIFVTPNLSSITPGFGSLAGFFLLLAILFIILYILIRLWEKQLAVADSLKTENQTPEAVDDLPSYSDFRLTSVGEVVNFTESDTDNEEGQRFKTAMKTTTQMLQTHSEASIEEERPKLHLDNIADATLATIDPKKSIPRYLFRTQIAVQPRVVLLTEILKEAMAYPEFDIPMYKPLIDISADLFLPNINYVSQNSISLLETNQEFIEAYMVGLNHEFARELLWREYPTDQRGSYFRQFWDVSDFLYDEKDLISLTKIAIKKLYTLEEFDTAKDQVIADHPGISDRALNGKILEQIVRNRYSDLDEEAYQAKLEAEGNRLDEKLNEEIRESLKDIPELHWWSKFSKLGDHDHRENYKKSKMNENPDAETSEDKSEVVLVIRGELLKKYPNAVIYAHKAEWQYRDGEIDTGEERVLVEITEEEKDDPPRTKIKTPLYEAKVEPDIYFFGFDLDAVTAKGGTGDDEDTAPGWFFVIKERPGEPRFGLDIGDTAPEDVQVWNDLSWGTITPEVEEGGFINITDQTNPIDVGDNEPGTGEIEKLPQHLEDKQLLWNADMNSATLAYCLYQSPVMMAIHAAEMLPKTE